jgi:tRNA nucleotidyltransferase/poly(A) polymerase
MDIHPKISEILKTIEDGGHAAYLVGGCVRDMLMERRPTDWDIATDALPERIQELFPDNF